MMTVAQPRVLEVRNLVAANDLNQATKRLMDFVKDFAIETSRTQEVIEIRAKYNSLREDLRRFGKTNQVEARATELRYAILDFVDTIHDEHNSIQQPDRKSQTRVPALEGRLARSRPPKTQYERAKEAFVAHRTESRPPSSVVFNAKDITKVYRGKSIDFTLHLDKLQLKLGEITSVVGENGNGKTTLLEIIAGRRSTTAGSIEYPGLTVNGEADHYAIKQQIAYIPQELPNLPGLLVDNLHFSAAAHGIKGRRNIDEVDFIISRLGLDIYRNALWKEISGGFRMRFALAKALVWNPKLLILDEPLANLDINMQLFFLQDLRYLADSVANPVAIVMSSQHLHSIERISDNIVFLQDGAALYNGKQEDFGRDRQDNAYELACNLSKEALADLLEEITYKSIEEAGFHFIVYTPRSVAVNEFLGLFTKHEISITYFRDISTSTRKLFRMQQ